MQAYLRILYNGTQILHSILTVPLKISLCDPRGTSVSSAARFAKSSTVGPSPSLLSIGSSTGYFVAPKSNVKWPTNDPILIRYYLTEKSSHGSPMSNKLFLPWTNVNFSMSSSFPSAILKFLSICAHSSIYTATLSLTNCGFVRLDGNRRRNRRNTWKWKQSIFDEFLRTSMHRLALPVVSVVAVGFGGALGVLFERWKASPCACYY